MTPGTPSPALAAAAERLYGLPLEDFTATRNALARQTAENGDRQGAEAIRSLRKPSAAAWALNQLARARGDEVRELIAAGERLRTAQEELLAGGDRAAFREASKLEQQLVAGLAAKAVQIARDSGAAATEALERRISDTLRAAALDPGVAESLVAGQLVREHAAAAMAGGLPTDGARPRPAARARRSERAAAEQLRQAERRLDDAVETEQSARKQHESAGRQTARLRKLAEEALERLRAAEADQQAAERALARASEDRERLARKAEELRRRTGG